MQPEPCKFCKTTKYLQPKQHSDTRQRWVLCDGCGRISKPAETPEEALENWNAEQRFTTKG